MEVISEQIISENYINNPLRPWLICLAASLFFLFTFLQTSILNSISVYLVTDLKISIQQLSGLSSIYFLATALFFIPVGICFDYYSIRNLLLLGLTISIIGSCIFALTTTYYGAQTARFLSGIGYCFALLGCFNLTWKWLRSKIAFALGISTSMALTGNLLAQTPIVYIAQLFNWRTTLWIASILGLLILVIIAIYVKDTSPKSSTKLIPAKFYITNIKKMLPNPHLWLCAVYACLVNTPILFLGDLWGNLYLIQTTHMDNESASQVSSMLFLGLIFGCPIIGWVSDYLKNRYLVMIFNTVIMLITITPLLNPTHSSPSLLMVTFFSLGFFASAQSLCYPLIAAKYQPQEIGLATGILTTLIMFGNAILQWLFGWVINFNRNYVHANHASYYVLISYQHALGVMLVSFIMSLLITIFLYIYDSKIKNNSKLTISQLQH